MTTGGITDTGFIDRYITSENTISDEAAEVGMIAAAIRQYEYAQSLAAGVVIEDDGKGRPSRWRELGRMDAFTRFEF